MQAIGFTITQEATRGTLEQLYTSPPGVIGTVGEREGHLHCSGAGSPTVLLEAGAIAFSTTWTHVQAHLSHETRVCSYDRAGYGWSEARPAHQGVDDVATDLRALLQAAGETDRSFPPSQRP